MKTGRTHNNESVAGSGLLSKQLILVPEVTEGGKLRLLARLVGAAIAGDLAVEVRPLDDVGTLFDQPMIASESVAPAVIGGDALAQYVFNVQGIRGVEVRVKNNNVAAKNATVAYGIE